MSAKAPEQLPIDQRDFPPRDMAHLHHARDSGLLLLMVSDICWRCLEALCCLEFSRPRQRRSRLHPSCSRARTHCSPATTSAPRAGRWIASLIETCKLNAVVDPLGVDDGRADETRQPVASIAHQRADALDLRKTSLSVVEVGRLHRFR
jgi:hypothetical protein